MPEADVEVAVGFKQLPTISMPEATDGYVATGASTGSYTIKTSDDPGKTVGCCTFAQETVGKIDDGTFQLYQRVTVTPEAQDNYCYDQIHYCERLDEGWSGWDNVTTEDSAYTFLTQCDEIQIWVDWVEVEVNGRVTMFQSPNGSLSCTIYTDAVYIVAEPISGCRASKVWYSSDGGRNWTQVKFDTFSAKYKIECSSAIYVKAEFVPCEAVEIGTKEKLMQFAADVNAGDTFAGTTVKLTANIDLAGVEWTPIGQSSMFLGNFNGQGNTVSNMTITKADLQNTQTTNNYTGFFGYIGSPQYSKVTIENLTVTGRISFTIDIKEHLSYIGGVVGYTMNASYVNCNSYVAIDVKPSEVNYENPSCAGGIVGYGRGTSILNCYNYGDITFTYVYIAGQWADAVGCAGGIGGILYDKACSVKKCVNYGDITAQYVGGICGKAQGSIESCANKGNVTAQNDASTFFIYDFGASGIVYGVPTNASDKALTILNCYNTGDVTAEQVINSTYLRSVPYCTGIGAVSYGMTIQNCYNAGTLITNNPFLGQEEEARCGEITSMYLINGSNYFGWQTVKMDTSLKVENCYSSAELAKLADPAAALGTAYQSNGGGTPLLTTEPEPDSTATYTVTFRITGGTDSNVLTVSKDGNTISPTEGVYKLNPGTYTYTVLDSEHGYGAAGSFSVYCNKTVSISMIETSTVTFTVAPASAVVEIDGAIQSNVERGTDTATYKFILEKDATLSYSATAVGYNSVSRQFTAEDGSELTVTLTGSVRPSQENSKFIYGDGNKGKTSTITAGGTYYLGDRATGVLTIDTTAAVILIGSGTGDDDSYDNLYIKCTQAGTNLTLKDVYISNSNATANTIDFTGKGNKLCFDGLCVIDHIGNSNGYAMIHVNTNTSLTITGGTAYLYKYDQGAGIGGNGSASGTDGNIPEVNGTIIIQNATLFMKGSKQGALIGSGAGVGSKAAGDITINSSTLNLIANARGAAIGGSAGSSGAGQGGNVTVINSSVTIHTNFTGPAIGGGGYDSGHSEYGGTLTYISGSIRTYLDQNAVNGCGWDVTQAGVNGNKAITATVENRNGEKLYLFELDTDGISPLSGNYPYWVLDANNNTIYQGDLHQYRYVNDQVTQANETKPQHTIDNWVETTDTKLYLYLTGETQIITINGVNYWVIWDSSTETFSDIAPITAKQLPTPASLSTQEVTKDSITLTELELPEVETTATREYRIYSEDGVTEWQTSNVFTGLMPNTQYQFQARYRATNTKLYISSQPSEILTVKTAVDTEAFKPEILTGTTGAVTATISGTSLSYYADKDGVLTADLTTGKSSVTSVQVTIKADTLSAMAPQVKAKAATASYSLKIKTDLGQITLSNAALAGLANTSKDAVLSVSTSTDQGNTVYSYRVNGSTYTASGTVTLELPYSRQSSTKSVVVYNGKNEVESTYSVSGATITLTTSYLGDFTVKEETRGDPYASVWDGLSLDLSWFTPGKSTYYISSPAQLAGLAALVNGIYNEEITTIVGDADYIVDNVSKGSSSEDGGSNQSTDTYHYGDYNFAGATIYLTADIDMGGSQGANYMPIGGQYLMVKDDTSTKIDASFCGTLDGQGHTISNISCDRHSSGNYGDGQSVGLIGRLGVHDSDSASLRPTGAGVRNLAVEGSFYANRSVGGIVGKIGKTVGGVTIENCANFASVTATDAKGCGGIVGAAWNGGVIRNCYNAGTITSTYPNPTGGIAGSNEVSIENCYNVGTISASSSSYAMAIGTNNGGAPYSVITNCWYLDGSAPGGGYYSSGANNDGAMTEANMKKQSFVTTLGDAFAMDTNNINNGYPVLSWQPHTATTSPELKATTVVGRDGTATITIDSAALATTLKGLKTSTELSITADNSANATITGVETRLSLSDLKSIATADHTLLIDTPVAQFNLPNAALRAIAAQSGNEVTISAAQTEGGAVRIQIAVDGQVMTTVSGGFQVTLPVSAKTNNTILVRIDGDGNEVQVEDAAFSADGKSVTVTVDGTCILKVTEKTTAVLSTTEIDKGVATTTIDSTALLEALEKADGEQLSIEAEIPDGIYVYSAVTVLTGEDVRNIARSGSALKVSSPLADITLSDVALDSVAQLGGEKVTITATNETSGVTSIQVAVDGTPMTTVADGLLVTLPVSEVTGKTILVLVDADGNETELTDAVFGKDSVTVRVDGSCTLKITEREETIASKTEITDGVATTTIDSEALAEQLTEVKAGTELVIQVEVPEGETITETQTILAQEDLKAIANAEVDLKITSPLADITLPASAVADLVSGEGEKITITAAKTEYGTKIQLTVDDEVIETVSGGLKVSLPVETATAGTVLVLVDDEGNETILKKSAVSGGTVSALLTGSCTVKAVDNTKSFADVGDAWYTDAVAFASSHGLFNGIGNDQFDPEGKMTRSMLVTVLYRLENEPSVFTSNSFSDVADSWYTDAVAWASANKIVEGDGNGSFAPDDYITREQMATILYRYMDYLGLDASLDDSGEMKELSSPDNILTRYADAGDTSTWANAPMQWAVTSGIITGKGTGDDLLLDPSGTAQRAEVATMLQRLINLMLK